MPQHGRVLVRIEALEARLGVATVEGATPSPTMNGLPIGSAALVFRLPMVDGGIISLDGLRLRGKPVLLIFVDPRCGPCLELLPTIAEWQNKVANALTIALVSGGSAEANRAKLGTLPVAPVALQDGREVAEAYGCPGTPGAVLVRPGRSRVQSRWVRLQSRNL
jgi:thiol-disulfide isomerase/thioredoxin